MPVPGAGVGALVEQEHRDVEAPVVERVDQRRHAVGVGLVHVCTGRDQRHGAAVAARTRRVEQRGEAAGVPAAELRTRLGSHHAGPVVTLGAHVHLLAGALGQQQVDDVGLVVAGRPHQRRLAAEGLDGLHVGATLDQDLRHVLLAAADGQHQPLQVFHPGILAEDFQPQAQYRIGQPAIQHGQDSENGKVADGEVACHCCHACVGLIWNEGSPTLP